MHILEDMTNLDVIKTAKLIGGLNKWANWMKESSCAACLDKQAVLAYEQATLAQHVRVELTWPGIAQYLAIDQVEDIVQTLARYIAQIVIVRWLATRPGEPNL